MKKEIVLKLKILLVSFTLAATSFLSGSACNKTNQAQPETTNNATGNTQNLKSQGAPVDKATAKKIFDERCSACHGLNGKGDGAAAAALNPKPRNYTDKAWQASITDEQIKKTIVFGGIAVGKSANMPSSPDLDAKPEVVEGLVKIIREFGER